MRVRAFIVRWSVRLALLALAAGVVHTFRLTRNLPPSALKVSAPAPTKSDIEFCRKLVISTATGGDVLSLGRVFTRRMRKGPFFLAAREMVIDRLDATLPESYFPAPPRPTPTAAPVDAAPSSRPTPTVPPVDAAPSSRPTPLSALKDALQNGDGSLKSHLPAVAGLSIRSLRISRQTHGAKTLPWLAAAKANAARDGLRLEDVWSVENGATNHWDEAFLSLEPKLKLHHP